MSFLLDTNVVSEWMKPQPNPGVVSWLANVDEDRVFISVVTLTEVRYGIERMPAGRRRKRLDDWLRHELPLRFEGRILPVDATVADTSGRIAARSEGAGHPIEAMDAFLAATAEVHHLTLVTRNDSDFKAVMKTTVNPWSH
jgi:predicted nucleic acid-binding protein